MENFYISYKTLDASNTEDANRFLMKRQVLQKIMDYTNHLFVYLLCFDGPLAIKFVSKNNQLCVVGQTLTCMNPDTNYHNRFTISIKMGDLYC